MQLPMVEERGPEKPPWGEPCNQCGVCCAAELCDVAKALHGEQTPAPCPSMEFRDGRFWCGAVRLADEIGHGAFIRFRLGIGVGCDTDLDFNDGLMSEGEQNARTLIPTASE